ncbi:MAG: hypothetical protein LBP62_02220 [Clostridiales bacterium]|jgi:glutathione synthase/RimK-type ligase-like ATP-grasp enzyme|nr:hypothetical protein [Clostridiales bacterium]
MENFYAMIVYNGFLHKDGLPGSAARFTDAARARGITLVPVKNTELTEILFFFPQDKNIPNPIISEFKNDKNENPGAVKFNSEYPDNENENVRDSDFGPQNNGNLTSPLKLNSAFQKNGGNLKSFLSSCRFVIFWDKDIFLCRMLEDMGLRVFNSSGAIDVCDDKALTALTLEKSDNEDTINVCGGKLPNVLTLEKTAGKIRMPKTVVAPMTFQNIGYTEEDFLKTVCRILRFPVVVKERRGSLGEQVYLAKNYSELKNTVGSTGAPLLFQEFIDTSGSAEFIDCPDAFKDIKNVDCTPGESQNTALKNGANNKLTLNKSQNTAFKNNANNKLTLNKSQNTDIKNVDRTPGESKNTDIKNNPYIFNGSQNSKPADKKNSCSFDIRVYVINGKTAGAILRKNPRDFRANIAKGSEAFRYIPTEKEKILAESAVRKTGLFFGGADIAVGKSGERFLLEVNSNAGFAGFERTTGIDIAGEIIDGIMKEIQKKPLK